MALIKPDGQPQRFRFNELVAVPFGLTAPNPMNQQTADRLNLAKKLSAPVVQQPAAPAPVVALPPPVKPFALWDVRDWNKALRGKLYSSNGLQYYIISVVQPVAGGLFVRSCSTADLKLDGTPRKDADVSRLALKTVLEDARGELWFNADYAGYLDD